MAVEGLQTQELVWVQTQTELNLKKSMRFNKSLAIGLSGQQMYIITFPKIS